MTPRTYPLLLALGLALLAIATPRVSLAMPMFSRKYHVACSTCHDAPSIPRLNQAGYKFRRAGFRMPEQIGEEEAEDFQLGNYFSARVNAEYSITHTSAPENDQKATTGTFAMPELSLYPITGSFQRNWATQVELKFAPEETPEIENAYLRGAWGDPDFWFEARAGIFHSIEGFGGSDRPLGVTLPLFESTGAFTTQDTLFRLAELNRVGAEAGIQWKDTSLTVQAVNSVNTVSHDGEIAAAGTLPTQGFRTDFVVFVNQFIGPRAGVSAYFTRGQTRPPVDVAGFAAGTTSATWTNTFDRLALFASAAFGPITTLAGGGIGFDQNRDPTTAEKTRFRSGGAFVEGDASVIAALSMFLRLDYFDPSADVAKNTQLAATAGAVIHDGWVFATPELQLRSISVGDETRTDTLFVVRVSAVY